MGAEPYEIKALSILLKSDAKLAFQQTSIKLLVAAIEKKQADSGSFVDVENS